MRNKESEYMQWAKLSSRAPVNLATSGVGPYPLAELPFDFQTLQINGPSRYGYEPLQQAIAAKCGVSPDCVVAAAGTSMANYLAMAALLEPDDEVVIEQPAYELLTSAARYFTPHVKRFLRREENGFRLEPREVERAVSTRTQLIVITNLHNPSSAMANEVEIRAIGEIARGIGARVLVDEVYLDAIYENTPPSSFHYGPEFVVTTSLTKLYGLSGLRCGWILAEPDLARAMWRLNDLFGSIPAFPAEQLSVAALINLPAIRDRARRIVDEDRKLLTAMLDRRTEQLHAVRTEWGTTSFVRLLAGDAEGFIRLLRDEFETSVAPGRFFEMPDHFRIGMGVDHAMFAEGLRRIELALSRYSSE